MGTTGSKTSPARDAHTSWRYRGAPGGGGDAQAGHSASHRRLPVLFVGAATPPALLHEHTLSSSPNPISLIAVNTLEEAKAVALVSVPSAAVGEGSTDAPVAKAKVVAVPGLPSAVVVQYGSTAADHEAGAYSVLLSCHVMFLTQRRACTLVDTALAFTAWVGSFAGVFCAMLVAEEVLTVAHREACLTQGRCHMVTTQVAEVADVVARLATFGDGAVACHLCGLVGLTPQQFVTHMPLYHSADARSAACPVCEGSAAPGSAAGSGAGAGAGSGASAADGAAAAASLLQHVRDAHSPAAHPHKRHRELFFCSFGLVVVRRPSDGRFLLVDERQGRGYWLPGGGLDARESPAEGAVRETLEEGGVAVRITRTLRMEYWSEGGEVAKLRVIFLGEPLDGAAPAKGVPDWETAGSVWVTPEEVVELSRARKLRGGYLSEPLQWIPFVAGGGNGAPLDALVGDEGSLPALHPARTAEPFTGLV